MEPEAVEEGQQMGIACNLGRIDRTVRIALGLGLGIWGIFINSHPYLGRLLGIAGAIVILSATWGT